MSETELPERHKIFHKRRASDTEWKTQVKDVFLQYKAIGAICICLIAAIYIIYGDIKESTKDQVQIMRDSNKQMTGIVENNARLVEKTATALDNNTKALNNNSQVMQEFGARVDKIENTVKGLGHRVSNVENAVRGQPKTIEGEIP